MTTAFPDLKDAITAVLGASVSLGGLILVFSGALFALGRPDSSTSDARLKRYRRAGWIGLFPFSGALVVAGVSLLYWAFPSDYVAHIIMVSFIVVMVATIGYGFWAANSLSS